MLKNRYVDINMMWRAAATYVIEKGTALDSRDGGCVEIIGYSGTLLDTQHNFLVNPGRKLSPAYAAAELMWYLRGTKDITSIKAYAPQYCRFAENDQAYGAYGWRLVANPGYLLERRLLKLDAQGQVAAVIKLLKEQPNTRQAVITMWDSGDLAHAIVKDHKDLPCTLSIQFILREGKLHAIATMRSNDMWLGFPYDVFCFTCLQMLIAQSLGVEAGTYTHNVGSLHIYNRDMLKIQHAVTTGEDYSPPHGWICNGDVDVKQRIDAALEYEELARKTNFGWDKDLFIQRISDKCGMCTMLEDLVRCAARKWHDDIHPLSPRMQEAWKYVGH